MPNLQCMLAARAPELKKLVYPISVSYKLDGVRCLIVGGVAYSRNMKPIPSLQVQQIFGRHDLDGLDGELIVGPPNAPDVYRRTTSSTMARNNPDDVRFYVFDDYGLPGIAHEERLGWAAKAIHTARNARVELVKHTLIHNEEELLAAENHALEQGYEGLMLRDREGPYKFGRSTTREGYLMKLKRFLDSEAVIQGVEELEHNDNEATRDDLGRIKRATHKAGKVRGGVLGALCVQDVQTGIAFNVGSGFNAEERERFWRTRDSLIGQVIRYRYFPSGSKNKPRFPVFCGFRHPIDM